jgi:nicotinamidase/pyrazinamidase
MDVIHRVAPQFEHIVLTQDWHTAGHSSFASSYAGKKPFEPIELSYGAQTLWPDHCVRDFEQQFREQAYLLMC